MFVAYMTHVEAGDYRARTILEVTTARATSPQLG